MPVGENFWNPYRWVTVSNRPIEHNVPHYHHTFSGLSGRLWCELEALTPLLIGDGRVPNIQFVRHQHNRDPYIPATSIKGSIRSLAEVVGNAAVPFPKISVDDAHKLSQARRKVSDVAKFDVVARTFGYLNSGEIVAGLIHFSDAELIKSPQPPNQWQTYRVVVGQPKSNHRAFYPGSNKRKFYHHHPDVSQLTEAPHNIKQFTTVKPAPRGTRFSFTVDFTNLRDDELNLLLYCLELEKEVTVTLSPAALGRDETEGSVEFSGPLRHKIGGAKPHGSGSVHIRVTKMELCTDATARYRGNSNTEILECSTLQTKLDNCTAPFCRRSDQTMNELRAMLIYSTGDPRQPIQYPKYDWFQDERQHPHHLQTRLKPTL